MTELYSIGCVPSIALSQKVFRHKQQTTKGHTTNNTTTKINNKENMSRCTLFTTLLLLIAASVGKAARLRNFEMQRQIDLLEEKIDVLFEQLESTGFDACTADDDCTGLPQCHEMACYCKLPSGGCDGDNLPDGQTGKCVHARTGCNKMWMPVIGCNGVQYPNEDCAHSASVNVLCDVRSGGCDYLVDADDADEPSSSDME